MLAQSASGETRCFKNSNVARRQVVEYQNLSVEELKAQLEKAEQTRVDLEKALSHRWHAAKSDLAQQIRDMIEQKGYDVEEIVGLVQPRRRRATAAKKGNRSYTRYVDPENPNNVYIRGVLPGWMKEKMTAQGYDPTVKEDREAFKNNYLKPVQE
jgi:DNA-binding protein H-NS